MLSQKKELEELKSQTEQFKNELEAKLQKRNEELHEKTRRMEFESRENQAMTEKLDHIEKQIIIQQKQYRDEYEQKKTEINKHRDKIDEKLGQIELDIAKLPELTDQKEKLSDELKDSEVTSTLVNNRMNGYKQRLDYCESTYKKLNEYMQNVKTMLRGLDKDSDKLEGEIDKSREGMMIKVTENADIRSKIQTEVAMHTKLKQMIADFEEKANKQSN